MKKAGKIFLIILLVVGVAFGGYWAYQKFFANKIEKIEEEKGLDMYLSALAKSKSSEYFYVSYNSEEKFDGKKTESGYITTDAYGYYHQLSGTEKGYTYVVKNGSSYVLYKKRGDDPQHKDNSYSASSYNANYKKIEKVNRLEFMQYTNKSDIEDEIRAYYSAGIVENESIEHVFGTIGDQYVWKITYKCTYTYDGKTYTSSLVKEVRYDTHIRKVSMEREDKELNAKGKVARKGDKNSFEISLKLAYETNQTVVRRDFSDLD